MKPGPSQVPESETMKPYYEADGVTIYHGDCRERSGGTRMPSATNAR